MPANDPDIAGALYRGPVTARSRLGTGLASASSLMRFTCVNPLRP